jgi:cyanophycinase
VTGPLALVGGAEFQPGNEPTDRKLLAAAGDGPAYVLPTAAARQRPDLAVAAARLWFASLGREVEELPVLTRADGLSASLAALARQGRFFYLVGGDPGLVALALGQSDVQQAMVEAWRAGAALAGSSAGAMALGQWTPVRERWPSHDRRRLAPALAVVPGVVVVPHYEASGHRWRIELPPDAILLGLDERTAALWDGREWRVSGPGRVTVVVGRQRAVFASGEAVAELPAPV